MWPSSAGDACPPVLTASRPLHLAADRPPTTAGELGVRRDAAPLYGIEKIELKILWNRFQQMNKIWQKNFTFLLVNNSTMNTSTQWIGFPHQGAQDLQPLMAIPCLPRPQLVRPCCPFLQLFSISCPTKHFFSLESNLHLDLLWVSLWPISSWGS